MSFIKQWFECHGPRPITIVAVATGASTAALDLSSYRHRKVSLAWVPDSTALGHRAHIRFGTSAVGAATASDFPLTEERSEWIGFIHDEADHVRAISVGGDGDLYVSLVDGGGV